MGARGETFAKQFESKAQEATAVFEKLSDADWKKTTSAEKWPVGVTAHHIASSHQGIGGIMKALADGKSGPSIPMEGLHQMNAKHAHEHGTVSKGDALDLLRRNSKAAADAVRALTDDELDSAATVSLNGDAPLTAQFFIEDHALRHSFHHLAKIRATVGR